ncbi:hypothetical protein [Winogradskyella sp. SYSU M77433]|uniref:hypothetical protein n=1 Tax=Winogradskyella sp. SYSU M77433 TaxID=3042722 RepID=UPI0024812C93|nr:hypothetical protein [Winogradskyella sp. SYSU M77433]MDH7914158.1 hypothetical protein [Winogradskyella sp. SYSU M77433]
MKHISLMIVFLFPIFVLSQVGVGTTNPDESSMLDISSSDKGVLVPRLSLNDVTNLSSPINSPATGLLVWNTNASVTGGNGVGFYFFNGAQWIPIQQTLNNDADFYLENTTNVPTDITDDIYTQGNLAIGKNTADYNLDISEINDTRTINLFNGATSGVTSGIYNEISGNMANTDLQRGLFNLLGGTGNNPHYGVYNNLLGTGSGSKYGSYNIFSGTGTGAITGIYNDVTSTGGAAHYGLHNNFDGSSFDERGVYNNFEQSDSANRYGLYNSFDSSNSLSPTDYGVFTSMVGDSNQNQYGIFQFIGNTGTGTHYGIVNQMQTGGGLKFGLINEISVPNSTEAKGVHNTFSASSSASSAIGSHNEFSGAALEMTGVKNEFLGTESLMTKGVDNNFSGTIATSANNFGSFSVFDNLANGNQFGSYNQFDSSLGTMYGISNVVNGGVQDFYGLNNNVTSTGTGNKYGVNNYFDPSAGGVHYGIYSEVTKSNSYSGYFLGRVSVGTDGTDNYILPESRGANDQIMQTDASGNVTWQNKNDNSSLSLVRVNVSGIYTQAATGSAWVNIYFDSIVFDTNGEFDTGNNTFTSGSAGYYRINAGFHTSAQNNTNYYGIAVYVNGNLYSESTYNHHNVGDVYRQVDCIASLSAGDTVEIRIRAESNSVDIDAFTGKTFMEIEQIKRN